MPYGFLTVGDLRSKMTGLPDDSPVLFKTHSATESQSWGDDTREGHNVYQANDDRYAQNQILIIELGESSP